MFKAFSLLLVLSLVVVFFHNEVQMVLLGWNHFVGWIEIKLTPIFLGEKVGPYLRETFILVFIPWIVGLIVNGVYWLFRRRSASFFLAVVWIVWLTLICMHFHSH